VLARSKTCASRVTNPSFLMGFRLPSFRRDACVGPGPGFLAMRFV
jgi:hypothetical protein